jgi:hypothetical protein
MHRLLVLLLVLCIAVLTNSPEMSAGATQRVPIFVELFTSEGCSDCPPADAFLQKLDQQPFPVAEMIVLSEHVDYWNHDGWKDPYSSHFFSERQAAYAKEFSLPSVYTPEMVVDGSSEFVGSNQTAAAKAFAKAAVAPKIDIRLSSASIDPAGNLLAHIESGAPVEEKADVYVAIALNHAESQVSAGENSGRKLSHSAVARLITKVGSVRKNGIVAQDVHLKLPLDIPADNLRVIAFVQYGQSRIVGATMQVLPK